jgi:hypothetical protein
VNLRRRAFTQQHHNQYQSHARPSNQVSARLGIVSRRVSAEEERVAAAAWDTSAMGLRRGRGTLFEPSRGRFGLIGGAMGQLLTRG